MTDDHSQQLAAVYEANRETLLRYLRRRFPSLSEAGCEDVVQIVFTEVCEQTARPGFEPPRVWMAWLRWLALNRAIDQVRRVQEFSLDQLARAASDAGSDPGEFPVESPVPRPSEIRRKGKQAERRRVLISDILEDYVAHVERDGSHDQRHVFERILRGQKPRDIAAQTGMKAQTVYDHKSNALKWIARQVQLRGRDQSTVMAEFAF